MKRRFIVGLCLLFAGVASAGSEQRSSYDPAAKQPDKAREGFVDFALQQVNPQNVDYGCQVDEARKLAVDQTIKNVDSWAVLVALGFLVLAFFMVLDQHWERNRREAIAAKFLAQYHNAWVDARAQAAGAIHRYNNLVHLTNRANEAAFRQPSSETEAAHAGVGQNREAEVDLIAQISTLQQQLNASHEREKNLQKELNKAQRRAPALQPREAKLPG